MKHPLDIAPDPALEAVDADEAGVLSRWRGGPFLWTDTAFVAALHDAVRVVRPLARSLSAALQAGDASGWNCAALRTEREARDVVDTLATDLLASALLLEALAGDALSQTAVDYLRRRRRLPQVAWRRLRSAGAFLRDGGESLNAL